MSSGGSSPLTRGKPARRGLEGMVRRLIPAHAGKTRGYSLVGSAPAAHPRSRGGTPHLRALARWGRLIPAHAGKTNTLITTMFYNKAHPRSRGENGRGRKRRRLGLGSSPLTRGKRLRTDDWHDSSRLIPAHAGKTRPKSDAGIQGAAHPRSRGENLSESMGVSSDQGSSPLTRGKPGAVWLACAAYGLIPAHAGKTTQHAPPGSRPRAHPRSRGENYRREPLSLADAGSSPLTRGKRSGSPD